MNASADPHLARTGCDVRPVSDRVAGTQPGFDQAGFAIIADVLAAEECARVARLVPTSDGPGSRHLLEQPWCAEIARAIRRHPQVAALIPAGHAVIQCIRFEKSASTNWLVALHQDLGIPVAARVEHPALAGWSEKDGVLHVQPPVALLQQLVAVRLHLDDCGVDDGPLRVVPGSHLHGRLGTEAARGLRDERGEVACVGERGSVVMMHPLLLHASSRAVGHSRRRVLHFLWGPRTLPHGLQWRYVA
ncbi:phytanoyl-CoA dioxygenase family protein [Pseudomonas sp. R2.Fl]|nr:phytanoyl-CoA dioxygenase family protein [Pseudomonas sp. R2.Fl]